MGLTAGTRLGPYEIVNPIGAGGMGEVYRARDTNLDRDVAIKVLPESFALDADRVARFTREAKTLASLNHPNIAAIYGLEKTPDLTALVMELVDGTDLSELIVRHGHSAPAAAAPSESASRGAAPRGGGAPRAMSIEDAIPIAKQIADALEAAHEQGIIHRDLKPQNIKVRADGTVKVLDFGLAKAMDPAGAVSGDAMHSPTLTAHATEMGMIIGTAAYMAPEQARGKSVDKRADIWAFGVVLHEMLTGRRVFEGDEISDVLAAVLRQEVDFTALPADAPVSVRRLIARCLDRDLKRRLRDIGEARVILENPTSPLVSEAPLVRPIVDAPPPAARAPLWTHVLPWAIAAAMTVVAIWLWAPWRAPAPTASLRLTPLSFEQGGQTEAVWSPDGKAVAFGARQRETDPYQLYVRYLDSPVATKITSTAAGVGSVVGWTTAGKIVFLTPEGLWSVSPVGGEPVSVGSSAAWNGARLISLAVSQDGTTMAGVVRRVDGVVNIWTWSSSDTVPRPYEPAPFETKSIFGGTNLKFSQDGRQILLMRDEGTDGQQAWLMPYPASAANPPRRILQGLSAARRPPTFSWMPDNRHVVLSASLGGGPEQLYLADTVSSTFAVLSSGTRSQAAPVVSPDGSRVAFLESDTDYDVVSVDLTSAVVTPMIATERSEEQPAWAARDPAMVYVTDRNGASEVWWHKEGLPDRPLITTRDFPSGTVNSFATPTLSPDGTRVIFRLVTTGRIGGLWMSAVSGGAPVRLTKGPPTYEAQGSWSPDGSWYAYLGAGDIRRSLKKVKTTGEATPEVLRPELKRSVAWGAAWGPVWSPAGDWILFEEDSVKLISPDGKTTRDVVAGPALVCTFSADGRTIHGLRQPVAGGRIELFSVNVAGGPAKIIGSLPAEDHPASASNPGLRLSLTPDGKSATYSTVRNTSNLWLLDGLQPVTTQRPQP